MTTDLRNGDRFDAASSRSAEAVARHARAPRSPSPWRYDPPLRRAEAVTVAPTASRRKQVPGARTAAPEAAAGRGCSDCAGLKGHTVVNCALFAVCAGVTIIVRPPMPATASIVSVGVVVPFACACKEATSVTVFVPCGTVTSTQLKAFAYSVLSVIPMISVVPKFFVESPRSRVQKVTVPFVPVVFGLIGTAVPLTSTLTVTPALAVDVELPLVDTFVTVEHSMATLMTSVTVEEVLTVPLKIVTVLLDVLPAVPAHVLNALGLTLFVHR